MLEEGKLELGDPIEPKQYKFMVLRKGEIKQDVFTVSGRRFPLLKLRKKLLEKHEKLGLMREHSEEYLNSLSRGDIIKLFKAFDEMPDLDKSNSDFR